MKTSIFTALYGFSTVFAFNSQASFGAPASCVSPNMTLTTRAYQMTGGLCGNEDFYVGCSIGAQDAYIHQVTNVAQGVQLCQVDFPNRPAMQRSCIYGVSLYIEQLGYQLREAGKGNVF